MYEVILLFPMKTSIDIIFFKFEDIKNIANSLFWSEFTKDRAMIARSSSSILAIAISLRYFLKIGDDLEIAKWWSPIFLSATVCGICSGTSIFDPTLMMYPALKASLDNWRQNCFKKIANFIEY